MKKSSGKKRVSSLTFLIATTAVLAAVAVLCLFGSNLLYAMRVRNVNEQRAEVEKRNTERYEAYRQEVQELQDRLTANNNISADWPTPDTQEGISIVDLTNYPLDNPGTVTASRQDVMLGGLLLVNEWHSRPSDFDESSLVSIMTYARSMGCSRWRRMPCWMRSMPQKKRGWRAMSSARRTAAFPTSRRSGTRNTTA